MAYRIAALNKYSDRYEFLSFRRNSVFLEGKPEGEHVQERLNSEGISYVIVNHQLILQDVEERIKGAETRSGT